MKHKMLKGPKLKTESLKKRFDPPTLHKVLEHPPDGGEGWCNPDVEELTLLQPCDWFIE
jgi:hypothetical protein